MQCGLPEEQQRLGELNKSPTARGVLQAPLGLGMELTVREQDKHADWACSDYRRVIWCVCVSVFALCCCLSVLHLSY